MSVLSESQFSAIHELVHSGPHHDGTLRPVSLREAIVRPGQVRFQRYPESDERVQSAMRGYSSGATMPPVLLASRGGETLTADGHHRLTAAEILKRPVQALIADSPRAEPYVGRARIGTLRKPRKGRV